jgi:hypothetical protein
MRQDRVGADKSHPLRIILLLTYLPGGRLFPVF